MPTPRVKPGRIGLLEQLTVLPPVARILAGTAMLAMGVAATVIMPLSAYSLLLLVLGLVLGFPLVVGGIADRRRRQIEATERARAETELPELRTAIAAALEQRHNVGRLLRQRGYTSDKVRRWIGLECDIVLPPGDQHR